MRIFKLFMIYLSIVLAGCSAESIVASFNSYLPREPRYLFSENGGETTINCIIRNLDLVYTRSELLKFNETFDRERLNLGNEGLILDHNNILYSVNKKRRSSFKFLQEGNKLIIFDNTLPLSTTTRAIHQEFYDEIQGCIR